MFSKLSSGYLAERMIVLSYIWGQAWPVALQEHLLNDALLKTAPAFSQDPPTTCSVKWKRAGRVGPILFHNALRMLKLISELPPDREILSAARSSSAPMLIRSAMVERRTDTLLSATPGSHPSINSRLRARGR